jgi:hypothetical protein
LSYADAVILPRVAFGKFNYWLATQGVFPLNFNSMSMYKVRGMLKGLACFTSTKLQILTLYLLHEVDAMHNGQLLY